jgi:hypothetical protein
VTEWVENPDGGRPRGLRGLGLAWVEVLRRPRRFFRTRLSPGDQAPGLTFAAAVVLVEEATRLALVPGAVPVYRGQVVASAALWLLAAVVLVTPAAIHLTTAAETVVLMALAPDRGGVSETVQVICYATAHCVVAGLPDPWLTVIATVWGVCLLTVGTVVIHDLSVPRALPAVWVPALVVFGLGFRGFEALVAVGAQGADLLRTVLA